MNKELRAKVLKEHEYKCDKCGFADERVLAVHHKDRNKKNTSMDNLGVLCRNCHWLEHRKELAKCLREHNHELRKLRNPTNTTKSEHT